MPDPKKRTHLQILEDVLRGYKYSEEFIQEYILQIEAVCQQGQNPGRDGCVAADGSKGTGKKTKDKPKDKQDDDSSEKSKPEPQKRLELTKSDKKKQQLNDKQLLNIIDNGLIPTEESGAKGGAGSWALTQEQLQKTKDFLEKREKDPNYKLDIPEYEVTDSDIDTAIDVLKKKMGKDYGNFKTKIQKAGGVNSALTTGDDGEERFRNVIRQYLKYGGRSVITGDFVNFTDMQLDHRIPYSSAKQRAKENGTTILEEQRKMDSPENWDMIESNINQLKSSMSDTKFLERINKKLAQSPGEKEAKKIKNEFKNKRRAMLKEYHKDRIKNGDFSEFSADKINKMDSDERNTIMKAWNYYHPSTKTFNEELREDPDYPKKLEEAGIKVVYDEKKKSKSNPLGFVGGAGDSEHHMVRQPASGGERSRGKRRSKGDEIEHMKEKTQSSKKFKWESAEETNTQNKVLDELRENIRKEKVDISKKAKELKKK
jgi:hypothetical protein